VNLGTALVAVRADIKDLRKDLNTAKKETAKATEAMQSRAESTTKTFRAMWLAYAAGAAVVASTAMKAIKAASDLQETTSKFNVVYTGQQKVAEGWAKTLVESYAMSTREAKAHLSSIQDLLVPMGMAAKEAGKLSFEIVKLAADLGSFNNLPTDQVMLDVQSALVGNYETMKKYGVVLNATRVQQEALNMGLATTVKELTAADKAQAAYKLIVEGSQAAIGDMERTSEGYANTVKRAGAAWEDFMAALGETILPIATTVVEGLTSIVNAIKNLIDTMYDYQDVASEMVDLWDLSGPKETVSGLEDFYGGGGGPGLPPPTIPPAPPPGDNPAVKAAMEANEAIALADAEAKERLKQAQLDHDAAMAEFRQGVTERNLAAFQEEADRILEIETQKASALREVESWEDQDFWTKMQEKYERLEEYREKDLISEERYQSALAGLNRQTAQGILGQWTQTFYMLAQQGGKFQKEFFRMYQAAAIAKATIAGVEAAVHAWDFGMALGGPALAAAFAAGSIAYTGAQIAAIASQSMPSAPSAIATSPAGAGGTATAPGIEPMEGRATEIHIHFDGGVITDKTFLEDLADRLSQLVEGDEVRLISSEVRAT